MKTIKTALFLALSMTFSSCADEEGAKFYQKLIDRYQGLTSYQDEGKAVYYLGDEKSKQTVLFNTQFADPNLIRFEFITHHPYILLHYVKTKHVIWFNGEKAFSAWDNKVETEESIQMAFAGATGISSGIAPKVPSLLMDQGLGAGIHRLVDPELVGENEVNGRSCHHLQLKRRNGDIVNIWISKEDMLIRRIEEDGTEINFESIVVNEDIPQTVFQLEPEK